MSYDGYNFFFCYFKKYKREFVLKRHSVNCVVCRSVYMTIKERHYFCFHLYFPLFYIRNILSLYEEMNYDQVFFLS